MYISNRNIPAFETYLKMYDLLLVLVDKHILTDFQSLIIAYSNDLCID